MDWDDFFMNMVYLIASKSKDKNTHIGAVIVGPDKEVRSIGYNSFPRKINDNIEERQIRPEKYYWFAHAETNAISNAALAGISIKNCILYTNGTPCTNCAMSIINAGIKEVVIDKFWDKHNSDLWKEHAERTKLMFKEAGIKIRYWEGKLIKIERFKRGKFL